VVKRAIQPSINEPSRRPEDTENYNGVSVLFAGAYRPQADSAAYAESLARAWEQSPFLPVLASFYLTTHFVSCRFAVGLRSLGPIVSRPETSRLVVPGTFRKTVGRMWSVGFMSGTMK
jgi:hypothetical protein